MKSIFLTIALFTTSLTHTHEYLYPVGHINQGDTVQLLLLYQKSPHHIELWTWHPVTHETGKALMSSFTPAGIQLLPDGSGFSFIDNDTIRVKHLAKRSPKLIPLYEPLYDFTTLTWVNGRQFVLSAKEKEHFGAYIIDIEGQCWQLLHDEQHEYRYPNILGNQLFYIQRDAEQQHYIMQATVDLAPFATARTITAEEIFANDDERGHCALRDVEVVLDCDQRHIAFLEMVSAYKGYYLEHPARVNRADGTVDFTYYQITKQSDTWLDTHLFTFSIPSAYLFFSEERLYESILPFMPRRVDNYIYYSHCQQGSVTTQLMRYNVQAHTAEHITDALHSVMAPYAFGGKIVYGGVLANTNELLAMPTAWVDEEGQFCVNLPECL